MPHLMLDYSSNIREEADMPALCTKLADCLIHQQSNGSPVYPIGGVRVRAIAVSEYCIANGLANAAFVHAQLKIGHGRSEEIKKITGDSLFAVMKTHFAGLEQKMGLALSLEINEFSESATWKQNNLHALYPKN